MSCGRQAGVFIDNFFYHLLHLHALLLQTILVKAAGPTHGGRYGVGHVWMVWLGGRADPLAVLPVPRIRPFQADDQFAVATLPLTLSGRKPCPTLKP